MMAEPPLEKELSHGQDLPAEKTAIDLVNTPAAEIVPSKAIDVKVDPSDHESSLEPSFEPSSTEQLPEDITEDKKEVSIVSESGADTQSEDERSGEDAEEVDTDQRSSVSQERPASPINESMDKGKHREKVVSKGKSKQGEILPAEILEAILYLVDPETFASLILVSHAWREAAQTPHLYAYHLSRCPSFSLNNNVLDAGPFTDESLPLLKHKFAREVKRNLFKAYVRPTRTVVTLKSNTTSSSSAFPGGEAFDFAFSPNGHWTLALSSSRIYVMDTLASSVSVKRELKVPRRPISAAILDDGSLLAVLSRNQHVHIYDLTSTPAKHLRSIPLENKPNAIALTSEGDVMATAFESGVEIHSLKHHLVDRRIIKCDRIDSLHFSQDATMLLGSTRQSKHPNTVIFTAPYLTDDNADLPPAERISHMWTTQIVFPKSTRDCSHATLLPNRMDGDANWTFTYDRVFESFRAVRADDLRNGTTYFTGPRRTSRHGKRQSKRKLAPCTLPAANASGDLAAAGFSGHEVWLYGVPEGLDVAATGHGEEINPPSGSSTGPTTPSMPASNASRTAGSSEHAALTSLPKWQVLVDNYRNVFAKGRRVAEIPGISAISWVTPKPEKGTHTSLRERLVIAAPGGIPTDPDLEQDDFAGVDGGRLVILDFDRTPVDQCISSVTFEVGHATPETLDEETADMETELALARHRTVRQESAYRRTVVDVLASSQEMYPVAPTANAIANMQATQAPVRATGPSAQSPRRSSTTETDDVPDLAVHTFDAPYSPNQPRSRDSIYRSATAVALNRQRNPTRIIERGPVEYRRPGDRQELPHESDADNWVPPPPPYAPKADAPLPDHLQRSLLPNPNHAIPRRPVGREAPRRANTSYDFRSNRVSSLPQRQFRASEIDLTLPSQHRSVSDGQNRGPEPVSPLSVSGFTSSDRQSEVSGDSRRTSVASSLRRPVSEYISRVTGSLRRPKSAHFTAPSAPPVPPLPQGLEDIPPIPTQLSRPTGKVAPANREEPSPPISMPSAEQLANLNHRARQAPPQRPKSARNSMIASQLAPGSIMPAPPRGARGAAGNPSSSAAGPSSETSRPKSPTRKQLRSLSTAHNPLARSSPALLRPTPKRLDTIDSVSSFLSRTRSRSQSRNAQSIGRPSIADEGPVGPEMGPPAISNSADLVTGSILAKRRSQSAGPALRLDRIQMPTDAGLRTPKRTLFSGGKKSRREPSDEQGTFLEPASGKGAKCAVM